MAYNSKYTGQEVEDLLDKIDKYDLSDMETKTHASATYEVKGTSYTKREIDNIIGNIELALSKL